MNFWELTEKVFRKRIEELNQKASVSRNVFKLSKIFIFIDLIKSLQKCLIKNKRIVFIENGHLPNFERRFLIPTFEFEKEMELKFSRYRINILRYHSTTIRKMIQSLSEQQLKVFRQFQSYMNKITNSNNFTEFERIEIEPTEFKKLYRKVIRIIVAFDSIIQNDELEMIARFVAFQFKLTKNSTITSWESLFNYCSSKSFGLVIDTFDQFQIFEKGIRDGTEFPSSPSESFISRELFFQIIEQTFEQSF